MMLYNSAYNSAYNGVCFVIVRVVCNGVCKVIIKRIKNREQGGVSKNFFKVTLFWVGRGGDITDNLLILPSLGEGDLLKNKAL